MISKNPNSGEKHATFIQKVNTIIQSNLENTQLNSDFLSKELGLSKMQVYRKIKAAVNKSTALYIRFIRLSRAKELLISTDWPISQIAYKVGFQDHSYFSRIFAEEFKNSPSTFRKIAPPD